MFRKIFKILFIITGILISLLFLLILVARLGYMNDFIAGKISDQASKNLNAELSIGSIDGNIFSTISINDISLTAGNDTLLLCKQIDVSYLLKGLLSKKIDIGHLYIHGLLLNLEQDADSSWNFMGIIKEQQEADTASSEFLWQILLRDFRLDLESEITQATGNEMIPASAGMYVNLSAYYSADSMRVEIDSLSAETRAPFFRIISLKGVFRRADSIMHWDNIVLKLENSLAVTHGTFDDRHNGVTNVDLEFSPLSFNDLAGFVPLLKDLNGAPDLSISAHGNDNHFDFDISMAEKNQEIKLSGNLGNFKTLPEYSAELEIRNLDASYWTNEVKLKTDITGNLKINGSGLDIKKNQLDITGGFSDVGYGNYKLTGLNFRASKNEGSVSGLLETMTFAGDFRLKYSLSDIFGNPGYDIYGNFSNLDLGKIPGVDSLITDLNGYLHLKGSGITPGKLKASVEMNSEKSSIFGEPIGGFSISGAYSLGNYDFRLDGFGSPWFLLDAEGHGNVKKNNDIRFTFKPLSTARLLSGLGYPSVDISGDISGNITGNYDSLDATAYVRLQQIVYDSIRLKDVEAETKVTLGNKKISGKISVGSGVISIGDMNISSANVESTFSENRVEADLKIDVNDSLSVGFLGTIESFDEPLVSIEKLAINYLDILWETSHDSSALLLGKDNILVRNFDMMSGDETIKINGKLSFTGEENLSLQLTDLDLGQLPLESFIPNSIQGILNAGMNLNGTAAKPVITGRINLDDAYFADYRIDSLRTSLAFRDDMLSLSGKVNSPFNDPVTLELGVPVHVSLTDSVSLLKNSPGLSAILIFDSLDIEKVFSLFPVKNTTAAGYASASLNIGNTINEPDISGNLGINGGSFENKQYGVDFEKVKLDAGFKDKKLEIKEFNAATGKGTLRMDGFLALTSTDSIAPSDLGLNIVARDFQAVESDMAELNLNSDIKLSGSFRKPRFGGDITVNNSRLNIDYFNTMLSQKKDDPDPPLLIQALRDTARLILPDDTSSSPLAISGTDFYRNLAGEIMVTIPGNTWVRGKDVNLEMEGSLRAIKTSVNISLFGDLNVKRGFYKLYGRSFDFSRGKLTFTGSSEFNPELDFEIVYQFRDIEKELKDLKLYVKGRMLEPQFEFSLDEQVLEEKDAISYIVFGKSVNQLGEGEREKLSGEDIALGAAITQLSSALKGVLQESAGIDVFEVTGGEDWKSGSVTIGKYITNKLFLSYDRSFDFNKQSKTPVTEKIMLEYQLIRNLIFKATNQEINSGFDLIFKKTWR